MAPLAQQSSVGSFGNRGFSPQASLRRGSRSGRKGEQEEEPSVEKKLEQERLQLLIEKEDHEERARRLDGVEKSLQARLQEVEAHFTELVGRLARARAESYGEQSVKVSEAAAGRLATATALHLQRDTLQEEVRILESQAAKLEDKAVVLSQQHSAAKASAMRGIQETEQLRRELQERRGERAALVGEQVGAARTGLEQKAQASALDEAVARLAHAVEREQAGLDQEQRKLRAAEERVAAQAQEERRLAQLQVGELPSRLEAYREEAKRCEAVATEGCRALLECRATLQRLRDHRELLLSELGRWRQRQHQAEASRDAVRLARQQTEAELAKEEMQVRRLLQQVEEAEARQQQAFQSQMPLRESCAQLAQRELQQVVEDHFFHSLESHERALQSRIGVRALPHQEVFAQGSAPTSIASAGQVLAEAYLPVGITRQHRQQVRL
ncbi:unnamed protein product [Polarella glacialis]|uniref:Uncharacterized protein n=1 Tax=Polarella glacialis TaxID=89957 RepID=A0A813EPA9_POLGL|nr:unnamed protein product [Polarella glacialis]CAE8708944.1 unnamed protein product [Polarella glacialis]